MNLMVLDDCLYQCAIAHVDSHVRKLVVESLQCAGSALLRHGAKPESMPLTQNGTPLKGGYHHHPVTVWTGDSRGNFLWTCDYGLALCTEYTYRFNKVHFCEKGLLACRKMCSIIPDGKITKRPQCFGEHKDLISENAVNGYRKYYSQVKSKTIKMRWTKRSEPSWYTGDSEKEGAAAI